MRMKKRLYFKCFQNKIKEAKKYYHVYQLWCFWYQRKETTTKKNRNKVILRNEKSFLSEKLNNDI